MQVLKQNTVYWIDDRIDRLAFTCIPLLLKYNWEKELPPFVPVLDHSCSCSLSSGLTLTTTTLDCLLRVSLRSNYNWQGFFILCRSKLIFAVCWFVFKISRKVKWKQSECNWHLFICDRKFACLLRLSFCLRLAGMTHSLKITPVNLASQWDYVRPWWTLSGWVLLMLLLLLL